MQLVNIGFGCMISAGRLVAVISPDSAPVKRMVQDARGRGSLVDATYGHRTKSVLVMDSDILILSALGAEKLAARISGREEGPEEEDEEE